MGFFSALKRLFCKKKRKEQRPNHWGEHQDTGNPETPEEYYNKFKGSRSL